MPKTRQMHDTQINIRAPARWVAWLDALAEHHDMTRTAYIRDLVRREAERAGLIGAPRLSRSHFETTDKD